MDGGLSTCQSIVLSIYRANGSSGSTTWRLTNLSIHLSTQLIFYTFTDRILFYFILFCCRYNVFHLFANRSNILSTRQFQYFLHSSINHFIHWRSVIYVSTYRRTKLINLTKYFMHLIQRLPSRSIRLFYSITYFIQAGAINYFIQIEHSIE